MTAWTPLRQALEVYRIAHHHKSLTAYLRTLGDEDGGWSPSTALTVIRGDQSSIPLMRALREVGFDACVLCGRGSCETPGECIESTGTKKVEETP